MNPAIDRRKLSWLVLGGGALVLGIVFISVLAPSAHPGDNVDVHPDIFATSATPPATPASAGVSAPGFHPGGGEALSLAWRLALVAAIIAVSIVGLRWWGKRAAAPKSQTGYIRVVDTLPISNGRSIHLVALGKRVIAVGATAQQLGLLTELSEEESAEVMAHVPSGGDGALGAFASELMQSLQRGSTGRRESRTMPLPDRRP